jgi:CRP/FNR family transcriptional regulator, cyclic AMP receptor protein
VGEIAAIDGDPRSASVVALQDTEAVAVSGEEFRAIVGRLPDWFQKIAKILVQRLRDVDGKIDFTKGGDKTVHAAALMSLMTYSDQCTVTGETRSLSQSFVEDELVSLLNMQVSEASAAIAKLAKQGLVVLDKGRVEVTDRAKLEAFGEAVFKTADDSPPT